MQETSAVKPKQPRPRAQFRLASVLIVMTIAAIVMATEADRRRKARAIAELEELGGFVRVRQLAPAWISRFGWSTYRTAEVGTLKLILLPDGGLVTTNEDRSKESDQTQVTLARLRHLSVRAGLAPEQLRLGIVPQTSTPADATVRANTAAKDAGFGSLWSEPREHN